jgi:hypothetical protein
MSRRAAVWLAWSLWAITLAMTVPTLLFESVNVGADPLAINLLGALVPLAYATVGALIASRRPRNPIGWLLAGATLLSAFGDLAINYAVYALVTRPGALPGGAWLGAIGGGARTLGFFPNLTFLVLLFPTGRLPSPRWRPLAGVSLLAVLLFGASNLLESTLADINGQLATVANPLGVLTPESLADNLLGGVSFPLIFGCIIGCCASVVVRFRRARGVERQQLKWLVYAALWAAVAFFGVIVGVFTNNPILASSATFYLLLAGIPVAVGIAILRHRLFDIDLLINRTLVYGSLTVILGGLYFASVVGAQTLVGVLTGNAGAQQPAIIVVTTLIIAALFQPLRRRIQRFIDRRFYRTKYDAARALSRFAETLRSEVELGQLAEHLQAVVEETMQPAHVSLWLSPTQRLEHEQG